MAVIEGGVSATLAEVGLGAAVGMHVIAKPTAYGNLGHYRIARRFSPATTTLTGNLWTFRNPTASSILAVVTSVRLRVLQTGAPTAAIEDRFSLKIARAYTVADTTGSASIAAAANMQELRTSMGTSAAQVREANIAAGASGGTKTLDTDFIATGAQWIPVAVPTGGSNPASEVFNFQPFVQAGEHPLVLAADEGFLLSNDNALGAASGIVLYLDLAWAEVTLF